MSRTSFTLGAASTAAASSTASSSSVVDPSVLLSSWRLPSLLQLTIDQLALSTLNIPIAQLDVLPPELLVILCQTLSKHRQWTEELVRYLLPLLDQLDELSLSQCDFLNDALFADICSALAVPLQSIDVSRSYHLTTFSGALKAPLQECRTLDLDRCRRLEDTELIQLLEATKDVLEVLRLSGTKIKEKSLISIAELCKKLRVLDVSSCILANEFAGLCNLPLKQFNITGTNFTKDQLLALRKLAPTLTQLDCQFVTHACDETLQSVGALVKLTSLDLSRNANLSDEGFVHLRELVHLHSLNLSRTDLTPVSTNVLSQFISLTHLDVSYNVDVNDKMITDLSPVLTQLRVLVLSYCGISDVCMEAIIQNQSQLQIFKVNGCKKVGDATLEMMAEKAKGKPISFVYSQPAYDSEISPLTEDAMKSLKETAPIFVFPHSLLSFDFGSTAATDACLPALGALMYNVKSLQRVGIWGSNINPAKMKSQMTEWMKVWQPEDDVETKATDKQTTSAASAAANSSSSSSSSSTTALDASSSTPSDSLSTISSSLSTDTEDLIWRASPPDIHALLPFWLLDESMKTQAGTFLFVRKSQSSEKVTILHSQHNDTGYLYGLEAFVLRARERKAKRKTVRFRDEEIAQIIHITRERDDSASAEEMNGGSGEEMKEYEEPIYVGVSVLPSSFTSHTIISYEPASPSNGLGAAADDTQDASGEEIDRVTLNQTPPEMVKFDSNQPSPGTQTPPELTVNYGTVNIVE